MDKPFGERPTNTITLKISWIVKKYTSINIFQGENWRSWQVNLKGIAIVLVGNGAVLQNHS